MLAPLPFPKFAAGYLPVLAVSAVVDPAPRLADAFLIDFGNGIVVPPVTCLLAVLGLIVVRPLARKREAALSAPLFGLVSLALLIALELWVLERRPGALLSFVMALGVGFAGYRLLELVGDQVLETARRILSKNKGSEPDSGA